MKENFDCTQFITFNLYKEYNYKQIFEKFTEIDLQVLRYDEIEDVKKIYLKEYLLDNTIELCNNEFIGDFDDWLELDVVPERIEKFAQIVESFVKDRNVKEVRLILSRFAEKGTTSNGIIKCKLHKINEALFGMSLNNFDIWVKNLIIIIEK